MIGDQQRSCGGGGSGPGDAGWMARGSPQGGTTMPRRLAGDVGYRGQWSWASTTQFCSRPAREVGPAGERAGWDRIETFAKLPVAVFPGLEDLS